MRLSLKFVVVLGMALFIMMEILSNDAYASDIASTNDVAIPKGDLNEVESSLDSMQDQMDYLRDDIGDTFEQVNINYDATETYLQDIEQKVDKVSSDLEGATNTLNETNNSLTQLNSGIESIVKSNENPSATVQDEILTELKDIKSMLRYVQKDYVESSGTGSTSETREAVTEEEPHTIDDIYKALEFGCQSVWMLLGFLSALIVGKVFLV